MEEADKGWLMTTIGVSGWVFLLVPAHPGLSKTKSREPLNSCTSSSSSFITDKKRINKFFHKANRRHLFTKIFDVDSLINTADSRLFQSITFPDHCLHNLLPSKRNHRISLRPKAHNYTLPHIHTTLLKNSFVNRSIFRRVWFCVLYFFCIFKVLLYCFFYFIVHPVRLSLVFIKGYFTWLDTGYRCSECICVGRFRGGAVSWCWRHATFVFVTMSEWSSLSTVCYGRWSVVCLPLSLQIFSFK